MRIKIEEDNLKHGVLGLVIAVVEVIRDTLKLQSLKKIESGKLSGEEVERLGVALMKLDETLDEIKEEQGISEAVKTVRDGLDELVDVLALEEIKADAGY